MLARWARARLRALYLRQQRLFSSKQRLDASGVPGALGVILGEGVSFPLVPVHLVLEVVDLAAGAGLASIEAAGVEKEGTAYLLALPLPLVGGHGGGGDQGMHAPVDPEDPRDGAPGGQGLSG